MKSDPTDNQLPSKQPKALAAEILEFSAKEIKEADAAFVSFFKHAGLIIFATATCYIAASMLGAGNRLLYALMLGMPSLYITAICFQSLRKESRKKNENLQLVRKISTLETQLAEASSRIIQLENDLQFFKALDSKEKDRDS